MHSYLRSLLLLGFVDPRAMIVQLSMLLIWTDLFITCCATSDYSRLYYNIPQWIILRGIWMWRRKGSIIRFTQSHYAFYFLPRHGGQPDRMVVGSNILLMAIPNILNKLGRVNNIRPHNGCPQKMPLSHACGLYWHIYRLLCWKLSLVFFLV